MSTITVNLPDELVSKLHETAIRKKVDPDVIVGQALANQLDIDEREPSGISVAALIGQDFGKYEGVPDLSTSPRSTDDNRYTRRMRLKELSGQLTMEDNWRDLEKAETNDVKTL